MRVLVTGGAGYIGSHTAHALRRRGHEVVAYDNLSTGHAFLADGFELILGDVADTARIRAALTGVDAVLHFAAHAYVGESVENPRKYFDNNVRAALNLLDTSLGEGVKRFVFSSTCAVYGVPEKTPISEEMPRIPVNPYGASKLFLENALEAYSRAYGLNYAALRYFNAAGAEENGLIGECHDPETHMIPLALQAASGEIPNFQILGDDYPTPDGTCVRDYIHVMDLADAHVRALDYLADGGQSSAFNLGTGQGYSVKSVISAVERVAGCRVPTRIGNRRPGDPPVLVADAARAKAVLGWEPRRSLDNMISTAWNWLAVSKEMAALKAPE
jgi:UDP-glucose-4-epimerase GalE